jgi:serine/threonine protein kinase
VSDGPSWAPPRPLDQIRAADLGTQGVVFEHRSGTYRTTGKNLNSGGMGDVYLMARRDPDTGELEPVVGKVFHSEYLYQLRTDEVTRKDHEMVQRNIQVIAELEHPNVLPTFVAESIADNYIYVSPLKDCTLLEAVHTEDLAPQQRLRLLIGALRGLGKLHEHRLVHRDLTLRNVLVDDRRETAYLFDFDLAISLDDVVGTTYKDSYQGRIFGSPGYSVPPEILDSALMDSPITTRLDIYAIGGAIFGLFTDELPYGGTEDMWALLLRISEGVVFAGKSKIKYPDAVPTAVRPVIEGCLERDPGNRFGSVSLVVEQLQKALPELSDGRRSFPGQPIKTMRYSDRAARISSVHASRRDDSITKGLIEVVDTGLGRYGYQAQRALGRVKSYPIFLAAPDPELIAQGRFNDTNTYPKIVTVINLTAVDNGEEIVDLWLGGYAPILRQARTGLLTSLHRVVYDEHTGFLFIFSEYVDDARFGLDLEGQDLSLEESFGLGFLLSRQVMRLHSRGMAHNNITANSLLLKGMRDRRQAWPAMIGIVAPSLEPADMVTDVRRLAGLCHSWVSAASIDAAEPRIRPRLEALREQLADIGWSDTRRQPAIEDLYSCLADALATIDFNFGVLRENEGDLSAYTLLLIAHSLYDRLWDR